MGAVEKGTQEWHPTISGQGEHSEKELPQSSEKPGAQHFRSFLLSVNEEAQAAFGSRLVTMRRSAEGRCQGEKTINTQSWILDQISPEA